MLTLALILQLQAPPVIKNFLPGNVPRDTTSNYIVIHNDGNNLNAASTRALLRTRRLSYHYFISVDGTIHQWKDLRHKALHAGVSRWGGLTEWNDFSIGICLQGKNGVDYTDKQLEALTQLVNYIRFRYPDSKDKPILGHSDIAYPKNRKKDPGETFELWRIRYDTTNHPRR